MGPSLTPLEHDVMDLLLRGEDPVLQTLRAQYDVSQVAHNKYTGVGFFTTFAVPDSSPKIPGKRSFTLEDVKAEIDGLQYGADFVLFVNEGRLDFLEGCSFDEPWPQTIAKYEVTYITGSQRDLEAIRRKFLD